MQICNCVPLPEALGFQTVFNCIRRPQTCVTPHSLGILNIHVIFIIKGKPIILCTSFCWVPSIVLARHDSMHLFSDLHDNFDAFFATIHWLPASLLIQGSNFSAHGRNSTPGEAGPGGQWDQHKSSEKSRWGVSQQPRFPQKWFTYQNLQKFTRDYASHFQVHVMLRGILSKTTFFIP